MLFNNIKIKLYNNLLKKLSLSLWKTHLSHQPTISMTIAISFTIKWSWKHISKSATMVKCNQSRKYSIVFLCLDSKKTITLSFSKISSPISKTFWLRKTSLKKCKFFKNNFRQSNEQALINKIEVKNFRDLKFSQEADIVKEK